VIKNGYFTQYFTKTTTMKKFFLFLAISAFAFSSCKKKDKDCSLTEANLVGSYKISSVTYKASASTPEVDGGDKWFDDPCEKDNLLILKSDHTVIGSDVGIVCSPSEDDQGTWSLSGSVLSIDQDESPLENFSCSGFSLVITDWDVDGDKLSINFTKQ
jgi:hypothetical protein